MATQALVKPETQIYAYEKALILGDLSGLKPEERLNYYKAVCESAGLNPLTKPFDYILLNGKLTLYAKRDATDQLRRIHGVSVTELKQETKDGIVYFTCQVKDHEGRTDISTGALAIHGLKGQELANALMKAETKAKRRATLSICGLGLLDETEIDDVVTQVPKHVERAVFDVAAITPSAEPNRGHGKEGMQLKDPVAQIPAKADPVMCGDCGKTDGHEQSCKYYKAPESKFLKAAFQIIDVAQKTTTKGQKKPYLLLEVVDPEKHQGKLYVWHKSLFEHLALAKEKLMLCEISERKEGEKVFHQLEHILELGGVPFVNDKPAEQAPMPTEQASDQEEPW